MPQRTRVNRGLTNIIDAYLAAKRAVIESGYAEEIDWQEGRRLATATEPEILRESAWVVLSSGMRETVVRRKFPSVSEAFLWWRSARAIMRNAQRCRERALANFSHERKIDAIIDIAERISAQGWDHVKECIIHEGVDYIRSFPYMGPATAFHLAKNLGLDVVKPDRHLLRVAAAARYDHPEALCQDIATKVGDRVSVVDLVLWRFATLNNDYVTWFT